MCSRLGQDDGVALIVAMMATMLMLALGTGLMMTTITETRIAERYRSGIEALYAADAGIDVAVSDLRAVRDWRDVLTGTARSAFIDGPPDGIRRLRDGGTIDLVNERPAAASGRPWRLYAHGPLGDILRDGVPDSRIYVVVWVTGDPVRNDDGLTLRANAYGPAGTRRGVEVTVRRMAAVDPVTSLPIISRLSWRER